MAQHLSASETRDFQQRLVVRHQTLRREVHEALMESDGEKFQELAGRVHDPAEESVADLISDLNLRQVDYLAQEIYAVESAIGRLRNGSYGICIECGNDIGVERLNAMPTAIRCIECQSRHEIEYDAGATPSL